MVTNLIKHRKNINFKKSENDIYVVPKNTLNRPVPCLKTKNSIFENIFHNVNTVVWNDVIIPPRSTPWTIMKEKDICQPINVVNYLLVFHENDR